MTDPTPDDSVLNAIGDMVDLRLAKRLGPDARIVTLMVDSGLKYLGTDVFES